MRTKEPTTLRSLRLLTVAFVLGSGIAHSELARAEGDSNRVMAEALFQSARKLMDQNNFPDACPKLAESQRLDPAVGTLMYLALCYERTGKSATAWQTYLSAESAARKAGQADRAKAARERAQSLEPKLPRLTIEVSEGAAVEGLEVKCDGVALGRPVWGSAVPTDPGEHTVVATAPGRKPWTQKVVVEPGGKSVAVRVPALETESASSGAAPAAESGSPAAPPQAGAAPGAPATVKPSTEATREQAASAERGQTQRWVGIGVGAVGLASLVVGTVFMLRSNSKASESDRYCGQSIGESDPKACSQRGLDLNDQAKTAGSVSVVGFAAGGAALAGGVLLYLTAPRDRTPGSAYRLQVSPSVASQSAGLLLRGSW